MEEVEAHLAGLVEVPDPEVRDHDGWTAAQPALLAPDSFRFLGAAEVPGRGPEVDPLDERARGLAHDHEDLARVDRDLAGATRPGETRLRVRILADDGRVDVPEAV